MLFHYNGHGVPRPTANGEVWVFNKSYTQYIPLSLYDLQTWVGTPAIYVFDCSAAGQVLASFKVRAGRACISSACPPVARQLLPSQPVTSERAARARAAASAVGGG